MLNTVKELIVLLVVFFIIDIVWLMLVLGPMFSKMVNKIQGKPMLLNPFAGMISYIMLAVGTYYFGLRNIDKDQPLLSSIKTAGVFGLLSYGIFDFTNMAIFSDYELLTGIIDTIWGGIVCTLSMYISHKVLERI
jgi:uncharacterized membrane protein